MRKGFYLLVVFILDISCETAFSPNRDSPSIPVVYAVLNEADSIHFIRLSKTFQPDHNVLSLGIAGDSLFYPEAVIRLERWFYGNFVQEARFELTNTYNRDAGLFPIASVPLYELKRDTDNWRFFDGYPGEIFRLIIDIPDHPLVYSAFSLIKPLEMVFPRSPGQEYNMSDFKVAFKTYSNWTEMFIRLHYLNRYQDSTTSETTAWREFHDYDNIEKEEGSKENKIPLEGIPLFYRIGKNIPVDELVLNRKFEYAELVFNCLDENLYQYNESQQLTPDQAGRPYSNVVNGIGIVGSRYTMTLPFLFDHGSITELCDGNYTKQLKFVDW